MKNYKFFSAMLLFVALAFGQTAQAMVTEPMTFEGYSNTNGNTSLHVWRIQGFLGMASSQQPVSGTSQTFNNAQVINSGGNIVTVTGTLNFADANTFTDVTTGSEVTLVFSSSNFWFYGATVKTLSDANVTGCTYSTNSNKNTITVIIPQGKTFGKVYLDFVPNAPMTNNNTTVTVPAGDYWVSDANHKPMPMPTVTYGNTTLTQGTDYTLSWSNNGSAGTGTVTVTGGGNYAGSATGTFPIRWATYTIHFDKNHNDATGTMSDQQFTYHTAQNLNANAFSRTGYSFEGWSTTPNGAVAYTDQQSVNNLSVNDGEIINFYAQLTPTNYHIAYNLNDGSANNPTTYNVETPTFTLNSPVRPGYTFDGWTGTDLAEPTQTVTIAQGSTGDRSYTANWTPNTYTVHFDANNGEGSMDDMNFTYDVAQNLTPNTFTREDYSFLGWNTQANGSGASYTDGQSVSNLTTEPNGTVNLYAKWRLKPWQGSGTEDDPYIISSTAALDLLAYAVNNNIDNNNGFANKYFLQTEDFTYNGTTNNYTPIGNASCKFRGHFDGGGFSISGINVTGSDDYIGVFGYVYYGSVENIVLANTTFTGTKYVGGIVGCTYRGSVNNCKVMGDVTIGTSTSGNYHGGIVGFLTETELTGCLSMATLTDPNNVGHFYGGIAGINSNATIDNCIYTGGSVTAHGNATAISRRNGQSHVFTNNYYYDCTVNGETSGVGVGGDVPDINGAQPAHTITLGENIALAGDQTTYNVSGLTAIGTTVLIHTVGSTSTILSGAMQTVTLTYTGTMPEGYSLVYNDGADHPTIGNAFMMPDANVTVSISNAFPTIPGMGTEDNPFVISSKEQLDILADMVNIGYSFTNKYFKLGADINYNPNELTNGGNYTAIGFLYSSESNYCFNGTFDGDGHIISGIRINQPVYNPQALFGCVGPNGTVKNVTLADAVITGSSAVGGIAGDNRGTVENCRVINCNITGQTWVGGIAGYNNQCENTENCLVLNTSITYSDTDNSGGAIIGTQQNCNLNNNYYNSCTVNGVACNIGCGIGYDFDFNGILQLTFGDITLHNGALPAYTLTLSSHLTATPVPNATYDGVRYYIEGTEVTLGTSAPAYTITSATLTYGGNNYNIASVGGVYSFTMPAADATVLVTLELAPNAAQFTKGITGYGNDDNPGGWYLIASPVSSPITPTVEDGFLANIYDLYRFNQSAESEWENWKQTGDHYHFNLESGRGYLYANSEDVTLSFIGIPYSGDGTVTLDKDDNADLSGWNLVGNPFTMNAYIDRPFYIMNDEGSEIIAAVGYRDYVEPMEGIFVQADEDGETLTFTIEAPSKGRGEKPEQIVINLSKGNRGSVIDRAIVRFDSKSTLPKLQIFDGNTKLYIPQDFEEYAIVSSNRQGEMPLNFKAKETGMYTISFEGIDLKNIKLIDILDGKEIDLSESQTYTFIGSPADRQERFKIIFEDSENSDSSEISNFAYQSGTDIIVNGEGELQIFDVMGRVVMQKRVNGVETLHEMSITTGVYILKLNEKTQKIVIR